jgi:general secretion pathway protein D
MLSTCFTSSNDLSRRKRISALGPPATLLLGACFLAAALVGCAMPGDMKSKSYVGANNLLPRAPTSYPRLAAQTQERHAIDGVETLAVDRAVTDGRRTAEQPMYLGTGQTYNAPRKVGEKANDPEQKVTLNFENGDIREIARNILGDLLGENYIIDPRVTGTVSIRTPKGVAKSEMVSVLETLLRQTNAILLRDGNIWRVLPADAAQGLQRPRIGFAASDGAAVQIYNVRHIGAKELQRVMVPFARGGEAAVRVDELRNILYLSGTEAEIRRLLEIATMFDIDILAGMSFYLHTLQAADVKAVVADWERVFPAASNPLSGLLKIVPIERMNALLIVSPRPEVVTQAREWIEKLDRGSDAGGGARLYVYNLRFSQAEKLQPLLQQALTGRSTTGTTPPTVAPGQTQSNINTPNSPLPGQSNIVPGNQAGTPAAQAARPAASAGGNAAPALGTARNATVVADKDRNSLLIVATPAEYAVIESVLRRIDMPPKQVAIEVQLAEVSLTGEFQFGLQSFFQGKIDGAQNRMTSADGFGQLVNGAFTYTWKKTDAIRAILNLSESKNQVRTLAQPTLITLDNQKASFNSGRQISVRTQTQNSTTTTAAVDSFQYINTGISLNVTPRVSGETVILEIQQEISDAAPSSGPNPDISKSSTSTTVMVQSGDTMLIGGLFSDKSTQGSGGLPIISSIPLIGALAGNQRWSSERSELALLITPRVLSSLDETRDVVDEIRSKLSGIEALLPKASRLELPTSAADRAFLPPAGKAGALQGISRSLRIDELESSSK